MPLIFLSPPPLRLPFLSVLATSTSRRAPALTTTTVSVAADVAADVASMVVQPCWQHRRERASVLHGGGRQHRPVVLQYVRLASAEAHNSVRLTDHCRSRARSHGACREALSAPAPGRGGRTAPPPQRAQASILHEPQAGECALPHRGAAGCINEHMGLAETSCRLCSQPACNAARLFARLLIINALSILQYGNCAAGEDCPFSHNTFEMSLHPERYKTTLCNLGDKCNREICFFAHRYNKWSLVRVVTGSICSRQTGLVASWRMQSHC